MNDKKDHLLITEYMEWEGRFTEMTEEKYPVEQLTNVLDQDIEKIVAAIRTNNLFPPYDLAVSIANSVSQFFKETDESTNELFVDWEDIEEIFNEQEESEDEELIDDELSDLTDDLTDEDMDDGFLEENNEIESIVPKSKTPVDEEDSENEDI